MLEHHKTRLREEIKNMMDELSRSRTNSLQSTSLSNPASEETSSSMIEGYPLKPASSATWYFSKFQASAVYQVISIYFVVH